MQSADQQFEILIHGTDHVYSPEELRKRLEESVVNKHPLRVKFGMDPTAPDLHLGHCVVLEKLRQFQDMGHKAVLIIGDYTAMIGDPTGQNKTRPMLSEEQIRANAETYLAQAGKVLDMAPEKIELRRNSEWLSKMSFADVVRLASKMTVARMLERDTFEKRFEADVAISVHEFLYPLCQGWDSVVIHADVELGGTDQTFNNLVGRDLQGKEGQPPQIVMIMPILEGTDGVEKMSKSKGNYIGVTESPKEMFGKAMSVSDELMWKWYRLLLHKSDAELAELRKGHPMHAKKALASAIVARFYGQSGAEVAQAEFEAVFSKGQLPKDIPQFSFTQSHSPIWIVELLTECKLAPSKSEARRLIQQGAVLIDEKKMLDGNARIPLEDGMVVQAGKRKFARVNVSC